MKSFNLFLRKAGILLLFGFSNYVAFGQCVDTSPMGDCDGDGVPNVFDLDDDNDGVLDCYEKGLVAVNYSDLFNLAGSAQQTSSTEVRLTEAINTQSGSSFSWEQINFNNAFGFSFEANLGTKDAAGADGIAVVFHNDPDGSVATGASGVGMGAAGIENGIVLELDTYNNGTSLGDIANDHSSIWDSNNQSSTGILSSAVDFGNLENGAWHSVTITWNPVTTTISYTVDGNFAGSYTGDLINNYFGGSNLVYFGFTASTGGSNNEQKIRFSSLCDIPFFIDTDSDGFANEIDTDSDNDGCYDVIESDGGFSYSDINEYGQLLGDVDANGVPLNATTGFGVGNSLNPDVTSSLCNPPSGGADGGNENLTTNEDVVLEIDLLANNSDPDNDTLTVSFPNPLSGTAGGNYINNGDGTITYNPPLNISGSDTLIYVVCDNASPAPNCITDTLIVSVIAVNDIPTNGNETITIDEDSPSFTSVNLTANNTDVEGNSLTASGFTSSAGASISNNGNGTITYTPAANFNGLDLLVYQVCDDGTPSACINDTLFITVNPVNDAPTHGNETYSIYEDIPTFTSPDLSGLMGNNNDIDGDDLSLTGTPISSAGSVMLDNGNGSYNFTIPANFCGTDTIVYFVTDGTVVIADTLFLAVTCINDTPTNANENVTIDEDGPTFTTVNLTANNTDVEGHSLTASAFTSAAGATISSNGNGTINYTPAEDYNGVDQVKYKVCDNGSPSRCIFDTLFVTINPVNDAPVSANESLTVFEDAATTTTSNLLANNSDIDGDVLNLAGSATSSAGSTVVNNGDGSLEFSLSANFCGTDTIVYHVSDGTATISDTLFVAVNCVNDVPANGNENVNSAPLAPIEDLDLLANNSDIENDNLSLSFPNGMVGTSGGSFTINENGNISYAAPSAIFEGTDVLVYSVCDDGTPVQCVSDTITVQVSPNEAPYGTGANGSGNETATVLEDAASATSVDLLANNSDPENDMLSIGIVTSSAGSTVYSNNDGTIQFMPPADFCGIDTVIYQVCDGSTCISDSIFYSITCVNDAPVNGNEQVIFAEDIVAATTANLFINNTDVDGDEVLFSGTPTSTAGSELVFNDNGTLTYSAALNFCGTDTIMYNVTDGTATISDTLFATITCVNDAPFNANEAIEINEDSAGFTSVDLTANNTDVEDDMLTASGFSSTAAGTITDNGDGTIHYLPATNFFGVDTLVYQLCDNGSPVECVNDTLFITVNPINDLPFGGNEVLQVTEDDSTTITPNLLANNSDVEGDSLSITTISSSAASELTAVGDGSFNYTPATNFCGTDSIVYLVFDGTDAVSDTLLVTVECVNDRPSNGNEYVSSSPLSPVTELDLLANNTDVENDSLLLTFPEGLIGSAGGVFTDNGDGTVNYSAPSPVFGGSDTLIYNVCDSGLPVECVTDTVVVTVIPNEAPYGTNADGTGNETATASEDDSAATSPDLLANNTDPENDTLTIGDISSSAGSTVINNGDGTIEYTPLPDFCGTDTVTYQVCDSYHCIADTIFFQVACINDAPFGAGETMEVTEDDSDVVTAVLLDNNSDIDGDDLTISEIISSAGSSLTENTDGTYSYTPLANFCGMDTVMYAVSDGMATTIDTLLVNVACVNDAPENGNEIFFTNMDIALEGLNLTDNNFDVEGDSLMATLPESSTAGGLLIQNSDGTVNYFPPQGYIGADTIVYSVCDNGAPVAACVTDTVFISVAVDTDGDGIPDAIDTDDDNDGIPDDVENATASNGGDTDGDGIPDSLDLDSDNDGIPDLVEAGGTDEDGNGMVDGFEDADGNGMHDSLDENPLPVADTDEDGTPNYQDLDSDNDGIVDLVENGGTDADGNGMVDGFEDADENGMDDSLEVTDPLDTDNDGEPDYVDLDSDNDGLSDEDESDANNDGNGPDDSDGDGIYDFRDADDDNDGTLTVEEWDMDADGIADDCDADGLPNFLDVDVCGLFVPEAFTPNGDGINDLLVIRGIDAYEGNSLTIFNRWGNKVFEEKQYQNNWDGTSRFGINVGEGILPTGTYFYVLDLGKSGSGKVIKGYIFLNK